jgi:hypothetical protein
MYCGTEDAIENAIGLGWLDPYSNEWDTEEHRKLVYECQNNCEFVPDGVDPYSLPYPIGNKINQGDNNVSR